MKDGISKIGWKFKNTYTDLPSITLSRVAPIPVKNPSMVILNENLSRELGLDFTSLDSQSLSNLFSGNALPYGSDPIAQAYAGHQFGHFTVLGDGRAVILGEHITPNNIKVDIQYKGSGQTPYSRGADGRAALGPMLREYIISEAMNGLNIPTTRSLAVVKTGEHVFRESPLPGAILTRVSASHIRVGTFQFLAAKGNIEVLRELVEYSIDRHYPNLKNEKNYSIALLKVVIERQISLVIDWMRVGFIHGVMNTDNMTISGETIDYGPCAFMDHFNEETCFSSIDFNGRYSYGNQPRITQWNLARFAETLLPLIHKDENESIKIAERLINDFQKIYNKKWLIMMRAKLGLIGEEKEDIILVNDLFKFMKNNKADYTNTFCYLMNMNSVGSKIFDEPDFIDWYRRWNYRLERNHKTKEEAFCMMREVNPLIIPRNHKVEEALKEAEIDDNLPKLLNLLRFLKNPYSVQVGIDEFQIPSTAENSDYKTFCGT